MVSILNVKLVRDLRKLMLQILLVSGVSAAGIASLTSSFTAYHSLVTARNQFYNKTNFADLFLDLKRAPDEMVEKITSLSGVKRVERRLVVNGLVANLESAQSIKARLISRPGLHGLNGLHLVRGRLPRLNHPEEIILHENFFKARKLKLNETLVINVQGKVVKFRITGTALSPEYVYIVMGSIPLPNDKLYAVLWVEHQFLSELSGQQHAFNNLVLSVEPGLKKLSVKAKLDAMFSNNGGLGTIERSEQISHRMVSDELNQLYAMGSVLPLVFLVVASFLLFTIIQRQVDSEREIIATLLAIGFSKKRIIYHYLKIAVIITALSTLIGGLLGTYFADTIVGLYREVFHFPDLILRVNIRSIITGALVTLMSCIVGIAFAFRDIFKLNPAEALRPPTLILYHKNWLEIVLRIVKTQTSWKIVVRHLIIKPWRTIFTLVGIAFTTTIIILGLFWYDALDFTMQLHFNLIEKQHAVVHFFENRPASVLEELKNFPGVLTAEGGVDFPIKLSLDQRQIYARIGTVGQSQRLRGFVDLQGRSLHPDEMGLWLGPYYRQKFDLTVGNNIRVTFLAPINKTLVLPVRGFLSDYFGVTLVYNQSRLLEKLNLSPNFSSVSVLLDPRQTSAFIAENKKRPWIEAVELKAETVRGFLDLMNRMVLGFTAVLLIFAGMISFGVIYVIARITLYEQSRNYMTMQVLGATNQQVLRLYKSELWLLTFLSLPLGAVLGYFFALWSVKLVQNEMFSIPVVIYPKTWALGIGMVLLTTAISIYFLQRGFVRINLMGALKAHE